MRPNEHVLQPNHQAIATAAHLAASPPTRLTDGRVERRAMGPWGRGSLSQTCRWSHAQVDRVADGLMRSLGEEAVVRLAN